MKVHRFAFPNDRGSYILVSTKSAFRHDSINRPRQRFAVFALLVRSLGAQTGTHGNYALSRALFTHYPVSGNQPHERRFSDQYAHAREATRVISG